nr:DNA cytosine methyltransferase [uncultured Holophaga sp.]
MLRAIEFFSGIGGWRCAMGAQGRVLRAYDISPAANDTYALNHGERPLDREIASLAAGDLRPLAADTWLMSPPCQPFCRMGSHQDLEDRRSAGFLRLMELIRECPPRHLLLENVVGFPGSEAHSLLLSRLREAGMAWRELQLCPTRFGIPNLRPRVYLVASRNPIRDAAPPHLEPGPLSDFLDPVADPDTVLDPDPLARHGPGLALVTPESRCSACFIGGYGKRFVGSGAFLKTQEGVRRFSPGEVARLMGLPPDFRFPEHLPRVKRYKLLGNGLSIPVTRWLFTLLSPC